MTKKDTELQTDDAVRALAAELAAQAPPLSQDQIAQLRQILRGVKAPIESLPGRRKQGKARGPPGHRDLMTEFNKIQITRDRRLCLFEQLQPMIHQLAGN